jgi:pyruvate-formate lyase-activating enzyme
MAEHDQRDMNERQGLYCRNVSDTVGVHANGDVVCGIIDGRGDFVLGNVHRQSLVEILGGARACELWRLVGSTSDTYCAAIGKRCPLKNVPGDVVQDAPWRIRFLTIEPTTLCNLRCLACPVRDFSEKATWRDAYADGGLSFLLWDLLRRGKQHAADRVRRVFPCLAAAGPVRLDRWSAHALRGRIPESRTGTLPIGILKRFVSEAGPAVERLDLFSYGEPFLYEPLVEALRHVRSALPAATVAISTNGVLLPEPVEDAIIQERLVDWLVFSIDGCDEESYRRYRVGGHFDRALSNMVRCHRRASGTGLHVVWQYVVFRWNDRDDQLRRAIAMAESLGVPIWFDFAYTFGRSRRKARDLRYLLPYLRPSTALPGEPHRSGEE